jgi:hypothetical protein
VNVLTGCCFGGTLRQVITDRRFKNHTYGIVKQEIARFPGAYLEEDGLIIDFRLRFVQTTVITGSGCLYNDGADIIK